MTDSPLPPAGKWFCGLLSDLDAGANPRDVAMRALNESTILLPILISHLSWEMALAAIRGDAEAARRLAELFLLLADPSFTLRAGPLAGDLTTSTASLPAALAEHSEFTGLYL